MGVGKRDGGGKDDSRIGVNHFLWETWCSRLRLCRCRAGRTGQGQKDVDENIATAFSQCIREGVQTCEQKTAVLQVKAPHGKWNALSIGHIKAFCECLNMLLVIFLLNHSPVQLC